MTLPHIADLDGERQLSLEPIVRQAKRYGETKRGKDGLGIFAGHRGVLVEAYDGARVKTGEVRVGALIQLKPSEAVAKVCDLVDRLLHELREQRK